MAEIDSIPKSEWPTVILEKTAGQVFKSADWNNVVRALLITAVEGGGSEPTPISGVYDFTVAVAGDDAGKYIRVYRNSNQIAFRQFFDEGVLRWEEVFQNATNNDGMQWRRYDSSGVVQDVPLWLRGDTGDMMVAKRIFASGAPVSGWLGTSDDIVFGSGGTGGVGIAGFSSDSFNIVARDSASISAGYLQYSHTLDLWTIGCNAVGRLAVTTSEIRPVANGEFSLGGPGFGWKYNYLAESAEPANPSAGRVAIYVDQADGNLKAKRASGTVVPLGGGSKRVATYQSFINAFVSGTAERLPQWYTNAGNASTLSVFSGGAPEQVCIIAPFDCTAKVQLRGASATEGDGWGVTTVRLYTERSETVRDSDTFDFDSDTVGTFDLSAHSILAGQLVAVSIETTSSDGTMLVQLLLEES